MIDWSECSIEWAGSSTIAKIIHNPTGVFIEPNDGCDGSSDKDGTVQRDEYLKWLNAEVEAALNV